MSVTRLPAVATAKTIRAASYLALVAAGLFWGLGFVFGKYALADMPVAAMVTFRFLIASAALVPIIFFRRIRIARGDLMIFAVAALLFVPVQFLIQFEGLARTTVTQASLMVALAPVMIAVASTLVRIPGSARPKWFAIAASAGGAALVVFGPAGNVGIVGDALVAISLLAGVAWILITERRMKDYDPIVACACVIWMGTAMLVAFEAIVHPHELLAPYSTSAWLATAGSGILSTAAATVFWTIGLHNVPRVGRRRLHQPRTARGNALRRPSVRRQHRLAARHWRSPHHRGRRRRHARLGRSYRSASAPTRNSESDL